LRLWKLLRELRPAIVHTRNLSALEGQFVAALAGVKGRIHGEHGRDVFDLHGLSTKYNSLRRFARPLVHRYIAVSRDLASWLVATVGVAPNRIVHICNGVDQHRFHPRRAQPRSIGPDGFAGDGQFVVGSVGRMVDVKDYPTLVKAFIRILRWAPTLKDRLRLVVIGEGPAREDCTRMLDEAGCAEVAWLPGERDDIPDLMRGFDLFVLPSLGEGISNTILEAMASGLPVIATRVGGNPELVSDGRTGRLVPPADRTALARAIHDYATRPERARAHGDAARHKVRNTFSIEEMAASYLRVYDAVATERGIPLAGKHGSTIMGDDRTLLRSYEVPAAGRSGLGGD